MADEFDLVSAHWDSLSNALQEEMDQGRLKGPTWRRMLAIHMSLCWQPWHQGGVVDSLEGHFTWTASGSGGVDCLVQLPNLFAEVTPPARFQHCVRGTTNAEAEEAVCRQTLLFCITVGPNLARLHPTTVRNPDRIRALGKEARVAAYKAAPWVWGGCLPWIEACWGVQPAAAPAFPALTAAPAASSAAPADPAAAPAAAGGTPAAAPSATEGKTPDAVGERLVGEPPAQVVEEVSRGPPRGLHHPPGSRFEVDIFRPRCVQGIGLEHWCIRQRRVGFGHFQNPARDGCAKTICMSSAGSSTRASGTVCTNNASSSTSSSTYRLGGSAG